MINICCKLLLLIISAILIVRLFRKFDRLQDGENPDILGSSIQS